MTKGLEQLVNGVRATCGDSLVGVVLYGSAAGRDYHDSRSDENVMVLVRTADAAILRALAPVVASWTRTGSAPPLVLTADEWRRRADVFAIEYADLLERHRVLAGALPSDGPMVRVRDVRAQLESELTGKLLRFRRGVMAAGTDSRRSRALLDESLATMLMLLRATLHLHGRAAPSASHDLCAAAGALAGFDAAAFQAVLAARGGPPVPDAALPGIIDAWLRALEALLHHVDGFAVDDRILTFPLSSEAS